MFDVVGVTERVEDFLAALAARTGWRESLAGSSEEELKAARNALSYDGDHHRWRWEHLSAEDATVIHNNTRCDAALYAAAVELAGPPSGLAAADGALAAAALSPRDAARAAVIEALREQQRVSAAALALSAAGGAGAGAQARCGLLAFFHVAKTGGAYVRALMQASSAGGDWEVRATRMHGCPPCRLCRC